MKIGPIKTNSKMGAISPASQVVTLNVNELNLPIKSQRWQDRFLIKRYRS